MLSYFAVKHIHMGAAVLSIVLFLLRGTLLLRHEGAVLPRWLRILPHLNDTVLLVAAITLLVLAGLNPLVTPWVAAKIVLLLAYILLGTLALKPRLSLARRRQAFLAAVAVVLLIVRIAATHSVWPF